MVGSVGDDQGTDGDASRVTIRDVAKAAGVHISTVSRALDPEKRDLIGEVTRERILAVVAELGYRPHLVASGLRRGQTRTIGVVVPDLGNPIYAPFTRGATHALGGAGYMPLVADTQDDHSGFARILRHLAERRVEAIITTAARLQDEALLLDLAGSGVPVVTAIRTIPSSGLPSVHHDNQGGGRLAAEHLLELGHTRLAQLRGPLDVDAFRARSAGFEETVRAAGATLVEEQPAAPIPTVQEGFRLATAILRTARGRPTAVFVQNDNLAIGALQAIRDLGLRCPLDVSIVGYNDGPFAAHTNPPLTTVRLDAYELGRQAGQLALRAIEREGGPPAPPEVPPVLVVRSSTAAPIGTPDGGIDSVPGGRAAVPAG
jgi:LacI family transcriptional regulator